MTEAVVAAPAQCFVDPPFDGINWETHVVLKGTDGVHVRLSRNALAMSSLLPGMLEDQAQGAQSVVDVPNTTGATLRYVVEYMEYHWNNKAAPLPKPLPGPLNDSLGEWDKAYLYTDLVKGGDENKHELLSAVLMVALFLQIPDLLDLTCAAVAMMIPGKSSQQLRDFFHLENDFTEEEQKYIDMEQNWCK